MADLWYYAHDDKRFGPFSSLQLRDLADAGDILAMDTVWKTGVEQGVPAMRVRHLFPLADAGIVEGAGDPSADLPKATASAVVVEPVPEYDSPPPVVPVPEKRERTAYLEQPARRITATAGKGAIIMGQDGTQVKFKKQCTTCQHMDSSSTTLKITNGSMRSMFFCPKCRKRREVELRGS